MKIRTGDSVVIIAGKDKGKTGAVLRVLENKGRVVVAGINMRTRHMKATPQRPGEKIQYEASIHSSNVMLIDPKTKKRTRIGTSTDDKGKTQRIAKRSGEALPHKKAGATAGKTEDLKVSDGKKAKNSTEAKKAKKTTKAAKGETTKVDAPDKKPFWKRALAFGEDAAAESEETSEKSEKKDDSPEKK